MNYNCGKCYEGRDQNKSLILAGIFRDPQEMKQEVTDPHMVCMAHISRHHLLLMRSLKEKHLILENWLSQF